jgi:hypothetical protein
MADIYVIECVKNSPSQTWVVMEDGRIALKASDSSMSSDYHI